MKRVLQVAEFTPAIERDAQSKLLVEAGTWKVVRG
jgi:hypothetical protein